MHIFEVTMDAGGAIRNVNDTVNEILSSKDFGGCSLIYAKTENGYYGIYHLRSTVDMTEEVNIYVKGAKDSNEPYRKWLLDLSVNAKGSPIHFYIGSPHNSSLERVLDNHPTIGMERYLRKLCLQFGITNYDITLLNMREVKTVEATKDGIRYLNILNEEVKVNKSTYQTDEDILANSGLTEEQCLSSVLVDPNIDYDGALKSKYQMLVDLKKLAQEVSLILNKYRQIMHDDKSKKENNISASNFSFMMDLNDIIQSKAPMTELKTRLDKLKDSLTFKTVTLTKVKTSFNIFSRTKKEPQLTEIGKLFNRVENFMLQNQGFNHAYNFQPK